MLACGKQGLDWTTLSLSGYLEAMTVADPDYKPSPSEAVEDERLKRFHRARR